MGTTVLKTHMDEMVRQARSVAGCNNRCKGTVEETGEGAERHFLVSHSGSDRTDTLAIAAERMPLMQENALANFFLAMHETIRNQAKEKRARASNA